MNSAVYELGRARARKVIADGTLREWLKMPLAICGAEYEKGFLDFVSGYGAAQRAAEEKAAKA